MTTRVEMELHAGMRNHSYMYNRDAANQHPMSAITGLNDKLAGMGSVVEMTAFTDAMNAATVDGPAVTVTSPTTRMTTAMWNELAVGKYIIGPEGVKIFRCTAKTETSFSAVCVSVANLRGEKGDKGDTGNTGPKGDAYEITSADYEAIAEIVEDEYTEELASVKNDLRTLERKNKALTDLLNGQELRFDTEDITGASIDVASGCVADSILKVCGKSIVQDGTIVSSQTDSVKCRGKNLWDEEWEVGDISASTGEYIGGSTTIRNKNLIEVEGGTSYYFGVLNSSAANVRARFYDADKNYIGYKDKNNTDVVYNQAFVTPDNCKYFAFTPQMAYGTTYNNDIAIIKGTSGSYSPYSLQTITTLFPVLKSAGSVSDYIDLASARPSTNAGKSIVDVVRCVGSVDLGSLSYSGTVDIGGVTCIASRDITERAIGKNILCATYQTVGQRINIANNMQMGAYNLTNSKGVVFRNDSYTDVQSFESAMNGVILLYEKATPTTETLEIPTDLLNAINVEAGGQITFVDHTSTLAMPITTTNEWVVRNEEV